MGVQTMPATAQGLELTNSGENRRPERSPRALDPQQLRGGIEAVEKPAERYQRSSMLDDLANEIGMDATARLVDIFGGTRLYIPHSPDEDDLLTASLGPEAARKLARVYGGDRIEVPNPTPRRKRIIELRETGCSVDAIARKLGCTRRRVFQVLAEARAKRSA
jgi:hypothetical protein